MKRLAFTLFFLAVVGSSQAQGVWRCDGNAYSGSPCPGGRAVAVADERNAAELQAAREVAQREARALERLLAERRAREAEALATTVYYGPRREVVRSASRAVPAPALSPRSVYVNPLTPPKPPKEAKRAKKANQSVPAGGGTSQATAPASRRTRG